MNREQQLRIYNLILGFEGLIKTMAFNPMIVRWLTLENSRFEREVGGNYIFILPSAR